MYVIKIIYSKDKKLDMIKDKYPMKVYRVTTDIEIKFPNISQWFKNENSWEHVIAKFIDL